ncbi:MAG: SDR family NAD(P)-dependent oxidoreductase [Clostridia bacterium]
MRIVLITGAASGIGFTTALRFLSEGDVVIACDRDLQGLTRLAEQTGDSLAGLIQIPFDLTKLETFDEVEAIVARQGRLDVLVNCAGICSATPMEELSPKEWDCTYDINIRGPFFLTQRLLPWLKKAKKACIVQVSSMAGYTGGIVSNAAYSSSKAAVACMTKNFAKFCAPLGIRVNEVSPGTARTEMTYGYMAADGLERFEKSVPLGRLALPEDIAGVILFLASKETEFITGQTVHVNGGMYMP